MNDVSAGNVGRHQVGSELDAPKSEMHRIGQRAHHQGLGQARHSFEQTVTAGENRNQQLLDGFVLSHDDFGYLLAHALTGLPQFVGLTKFRMVCRHGALAQGVLHCGAWPALQQHIKSGTETLGCPSAWVAPF